MNGPLNQPDQHPEQPTYSGSAGEDRTEYLAERLVEYRTGGLSRRDLGTRFEEFSKVYLQHEPVYAQQFGRVQTYGDWARDQGLDARDTGVDLVAELCDGGYCAVQCKFYGSAHRLQKRDIDSFFTASGKEHFCRRLIIDAAGSWSQKAEESLRGQSKPVQRIGLLNILDSAIDWSYFHSYAGSPKTFAAIASWAVSLPSYTANTTAAWTTSAPQPP